MIRRTYFASLEIPVTALPNARFGEMPVLRQTVTVENDAGILQSEPLVIDIPAIDADITDAVLVLLQGRMASLGLQLTRAQPVLPPESDPP